MRPPNSKGLTNFALLVIVNAMWAAQYAAYKTASAQMGPVTVSAWTFLLASLILLPFLLKERFALAAGKRRAGAGARDGIRFVVIGVFGSVPSSAFLAWGTAFHRPNAALIFLAVPI
jgi:drug/metabolite transporter (DMT)-like permease